MLTLMTADSSLDPEDRIPAFLRKPERGTREASEFALQGVNAKLAKLKQLGLMPHPDLLGYKAELEDQLAGDGPYMARVKSAYF